MRSDPRRPRFPHANTADEHGVVLVGGMLSPEWILSAYRQGIFPWPVSVGKHHILAWFSPDPRTIFELNAIHVSHRLARRLRSNRFHVTFNKAFAAVLAGCAAPRLGDEDPGTWITPELARAYLRLHQAGYAHSVEVWRNDELVGGLYGLSLGGYFSGESMFHRETDASKVALVSLAQLLKEHGFSMFDAQVMNPHLASLGAQEIPRDEFLARLETALAMPVEFPFQQGSSAARV